MDYTPESPTEIAMTICPLIFEPIFKPRIWGGRRLASLLDKKLPGSEPIGESWELADLEDDQSVVAVGPARGSTLRELMSEWGDDLTGRAPLFEGRFPLLIKFLDATDTLSLQVHPDEATAKRLGGRVRIKNEAWYVIAAEEGGFIYRGLKPGVDEAALREAIEKRSLASVLNRIEVAPGRCYYLPSGTLHALGAGVVVAEVQTPSDITYRVYDWDRVDAKTGEPRDLHLEEAMRCTSFDAGPIPGEKQSHVASVWTAVTSLVRCESFIIERVRMAEGLEQETPYDEMVIWIVLEGRGTLSHQGASEPLAFTRGDTVVLPAGLKSAVLKTHTDCLWLEVTMPIRSPLAEFDKPTPQELRKIYDESGGFVQLNPSGESPE